MQLPSPEVVQLKKSRLRMERILHRDNRFRNILALISLGASLAVSAYYIHHVQKESALPITAVPAQPLKSRGLPAAVGEDVSNPGVADLSHKPTR